MTKPGLFALCVPALALAACSESGEPPSVIETESAVTVQEPEIPLEEPSPSPDPLTNNRRTTDTLTPGPMATGAPDPSPGDQRAIDPSLTDDPSVPEGM